MVATNATLTEAKAQLEAAISEKDAELADLKRSLAEANETILDMKRSLVRAKVAMSYAEAHIAQKR